MESSVGPNNRVGGDSTYAVPAADAAVRPSSRPCGSLLVQRPSRLPECVPCRLTYKRAWFASDKIAPRVSSGKSCQCNTSQARFVSAKRRLVVGAPLSAPRLSSNADCIGDLGVVSSPVTPTWGKIPNSPMRLHRAVSLRTLGMTRSVMPDAANPSCAPYRFARPRCYTQVEMDRKAFAQDETTVRPPFWASSAQPTAREKTPRHGNFFVRPRIRRLARRRRNPLTGNNLQTAFG